MTNQKQVALRIDESFHSELARLAKEQHRSIHAQVLHILQAYFDPQMLRRRVEELEQRLA